MEKKKGWSNGVDPPTTCRTSCIWYDNRPHPRSYFFSLMILIVSFILLLLDVYFFRFFDQTVFTLIRLSFNLEYKFIY